jgi:hypothetical protein
MMTMMMKTTKTTNKKSHHHGVVVGGACAWADVSCRCASCGGVSSWTPAFAFVAPQCQNHHHHHYRHRHRHFFFFFYPYSSKILQYYYCGNDKRHTLGYEEFQISNLTQNRSKSSHH